MVLVASMDDHSPRFLLRHLDIDVVVYLFGSFGLGENAYRCHRRDFHFIFYPGGSWRNLQRNYGNVLGAPAEFYLSVAGDGDEGIWQSGAIHEPPPCA